MTNTESQHSGPEPRQRILEAAIQLFARKGYSATGVRVIAQQAGVNQAMINYYFGSKINLLKAIFEQAIQFYAAAMIKNLIPDQEENLETTIRTFFREAIQMMRLNPEIFRITWSELHHDRPEIAEFKAKLVRETLFPALMTFLQRHHDEVAPGLRPELVGLALPGMVAWHFMIAPIFTRVIGVDLDDAFYDAFAEQMVHLALHGLMGRDASGNGEKK